MPELPDILLYQKTLRERIAGQHLRRIRVLSPFVLRTFDPPVEAVQDRPVRDVSRLGKRIVLHFPGDVFLVIHLMIAGRFRWLAAEARPPGRIALALLHFDHGTLALTEASQKKRASIHVVSGAAGIAAFSSGGLDLFSADAAAFRTALRRENHTLKRALTDPRLIDGIGNAYSDEILHRARLSPISLTSAIDDPAAERLFEAARAVLSEWTRRLVEEFADRFPGPGDITAFRPEFAVHGKFGQPCPDCASPVQRIRYADRETNYCPACQTGGRVLADRSLSRLLKDDWPRTLEELEQPP